MMTPNPSTKQSSIRGFLTLSLLLGAGFLVAATAFFLDLRLRSFLQDRYDQGLMGRAQTLITLTKEFEEGIELDYAGEFMPEFETPEGGEFFEIFLADGSLLEASESLEGGSLPVAPMQQREPQFSDIELEGIGLCRVVQLSFLPQKEDADIEGELVPHDAPEEHLLRLNMAQNRSEFDQFLLTLRSWLWGALVILLILIIFLVRLSLDRGLAPLNSIQSQVKHLDLDHLSQRIHLQKNIEELSPVVTQLNALLQRLEQAMKRERQFTSDVAHELRTPLAELRTLAEIGQRDPDDREMVLGFFVDVHEITLEMQALVENLLVLTRSDSGSQVIQKTAFSLVQVLDKCIQRAGLLDSDCKIQLQVQPGQRFEVVSDRPMLEQMVQNLVNNAVTHSPPGSTTHIRCHRGDSVVELTLSNPAPQLQSADLAFLTDRFWQKDRARTGGKTTGLGLSIVSALAKNLGHPIEMRLEDGHLSIRLSLTAVQTEALSTAAAAN